MTKEAIEKLEQWYLENKRDLSFRKTRNPYHIYVSEVMLQQTQVDTVIPYFDRFIVKYPTITDLANAPIEEVLKMVEGLGYYRRFRNMHEAAKIIKDKYQGDFPKTYEDVLALPGVGRYTAGAIMSIAYNEPYGAVDGNVIRVLTRFYGIDLDMRKERNRKVIEKLNQENIERATPWIYTQALMELGATLVTHKNHKMHLSPLKDWCYATLNNRVDDFPFFSKLKSKKEMMYYVFIINDGDCILLRRREEELLHGMYEYIQVESESLNYALESLENLGIVGNVANNLGTYKHVFSHIVWHMNVYAVEVMDNRSDFIKVTLEELKKLPMATAHKKIKVR